MITEDYVSFETAKLLKEKGFDEICETAYETITNAHEVEQCSISSWGKLGQVKRPTLQMAMKWLRDVHNYHICPCLDSYVYPFNNEYYIVIRKNKDKFEEISTCEEVYFKTYEEAAEAGIKYTLENLI